MSKPAPRTPARLDADRTATPLTRIVHHPPYGGCISPYMPLVSPEYEDEHGRRTPLHATMLTPSEVALAKVLAAWDAWSGTDGEGEAHEAWLAVALVLGNKGYASGSSLMPVGRALVDRARKAGVL